MLYAFLFVYKCVASVSMDVQHAIGSMWVPECADVRVHGCGMPSLGTY